MRVLVVDESAERAETLREGLRRAGYEVTASLSSSLALLKAIEELKPDVIVIDTESPSRDVLEHLAVMTHHTPRPVVMFANDGAKETIRQAVRELRLVPAGAQAKDRRLTKFVSRGARRGAARASASAVTRGGTAVAAAAGAQACDAAYEPARASGQRPGSPSPYGSRPCG